MNPLRVIADCRDAIAAADWPRAESLLADYDAALRAAADAGLSRETWHRIQAGHAALLAEATAARDAAAQALSRHALDRRGTHAYLAQTP